MSTERLAVERKMVVWIAVGALLAMLLVALIGRDRATSSVSAPAAATAVVTANRVAGTRAVPATAGAHNHGAINADEHAELQPDQPLDNATRDQLAAQLVAARDAAMRYPTVADATRGGFVLAGGFAPLVGAHYVAIGGAASGTFDAAKPPTLIYDGTSPTSRVVGLMYLSAGNQPTAPEGFAGPNDHWHRHSGVCIKFAAGVIQVPFPADADITKAQCSAVQGTFMDRTQWMVHAWVVPGWESPAGVFSHDNVDLKCGDGGNKTDSAGFCPGT